MRPARALESRGGTRHSISPSSLAVAFTYFLLPRFSASIPHCIRCSQRRRLQNDSRRSVLVVLTHYPALGSTFRISSLHLSKSDPELIFWSMIIGMACNIENCARPKPFRHQIIPLDRRASEAPRHASSCHPQPSLHDLGVVKEGGHLVFLSF